MISTKGRYAVRVLADLAEHESGGLVPLRDVSQRQSISVKYLQHIAKLLVDGGILIGVSGKGGGYRLARPADEINLLEVLEAAEGSMAPVACLVEGAPACERASACGTLPIWRRYHELVREFFSGIMVADLAGGTICEVPLPDAFLTSGCDGADDVPDS
jgi:Rrf2 family protein